MFSKFDHRGNAVGKDADGLIRIVVADTEGIPMQSAIHNAVDVLFEGLTRLGAAGARIEFKVAGNVSIVVLIAATRPGAELALVGERLTDEQLSEALTAK